MSMTKRALDAQHQQSHDIWQDSRGKSTITAGIEIYDCGCKFDWSDKIDLPCERHAISPELEEESLREYHYSIYEQGARR